MIKKVLDFIKNRPKRLFYKELLVAFVLLSMPFWFLIYNAVPEIESIDMGWFQIHSFGFVNLNFIAWVIALKLSPLIVLVLWFFSCKHWWRSALLVPIIFSIAQFINLFVAEKYFDKDEFWVAFLISAPVIMLMFQISKKINNYNSTMSLSKEIKEEIDVLMELLNKERTKSMNELLYQFKLLKGRKIFQDQETYLTDLVVFRNKLVVQLESQKKI